MAWVSSIETIHWDIFQIRHFIRWNLSLEFRSNCCPMGEPRVAVSLRSGEFLKERSVGRTAYMRRFLLLFTQWCAHNLKRRSYLQSYYLLICYTPCNCHLGRLEVGRNSKKSDQSWEFQLETFRGARRPLQIACQIWYLYIMFIYLYICRYIYIRYIQTSVYSETAHLIF